MTARTGPRTDSLLAVLEPGIRRSAGAARITAIERRPSAYRTSFALEELDVRLEDGRVLPLIFKDLSRAALDPRARRAKPGFLYDPLREIRIYRHLLGAARLGTALCYGSLVQQRSSRYWLFVERVAGVELFQIGDPETWCRAAGWLALMHARFDDDATVRALPAGSLIEYDARFYRRWLRRARSLAGGSGEPRSTAVDWLLRRYERAIGRLVELPRTVIHGEFYPSNVLVQRSGAAERICPVDWEMAARAPRLMDLAAFVAGGWSELDRQRLIAAYRSAAATAAAAAAGEVDSTGDFRTDLACCRLHVAVQWLAWSRDWTPPLEHRHDWLGEALAVAEELAP